MCNRLIPKVNGFLAEENGTTSTEYAVIIALIIVVCIAAFATMGSANSNLWTNNTDQIETFLN